MKVKQQNLIREQLDATLKRFESLKAIVPPKKGWIRATRDALGMSGRQLAKRLQVDKSRIPRVEHDEVVGNVTLKTMRRAAEALDCVFVYALVPCTSLEATVRKQVKKVARKRMERISHTMMLENQELSDKEKKKAFDAAVAELAKARLKSLWDE